MFRFGEAVHLGMLVLRTCSWEVRLPQLRLGLGPLHHAGQGYPALGPGQPQTSEEQFKSAWGGSSGLSVLNIAKSQIKLSS